MKEKFGCLIPIVYLLMGLLQLAAIKGGIEVWWGWPWWLESIVALPVAYTPVLGTVVGIMGAIKAFGWSPLFAILLFCWPYVLYIIVLAGAGFSAIFSRSRIP